MLDLLRQVRELAVIGFVGGSDLPKITEQLAIHGQDSESCWGVAASLYIHFA